ncbi:MAG: hypothetical protein STHCBS139747_004191 [Sporothrix thermara]
MVDATPYYGSGSLAVNVLDPPQTVSFAMTYPRSEIYESAYSLPVVFAISNPHYAGLLAPKISFSIAKYIILDGTCPVYADSRNFTVDLQSYNLSAPSTPDPFYLTAHFDCLDYQVGQWYLAWSVETSRANINITVPRSTNASFTVADSIPHTTVKDEGNFIFETIGNGSSGVRNVIDLVAGTADSACDVVPYSRQIDIVAVAEGSCSGNVLDLPSCAVVANDTGFHTSTPASSSLTSGGGGGGGGGICGGVINATEAALIFAEPYSRNCPDSYIARVPCNASETVQRPGNVASTAASTTAVPDGSARSTPMYMATVAAAVVGLAMGVLLL